MEVLGAVASSVALAEVAGKLLKTLHWYASSVKDAKADILRVESELHVLKDLFERMHVAERSVTLSPLRTTIEQCHLELQELTSRLEVSAPKKSKMSMLRLKSPSLKWPFKSQDITRIVQRLERHKTTITAFFVFDQQYAAPYPRIRDPR